MPSPEERDQRGAAGPRLLFISPVLPAAQGNGTAMRAALTLRGLAQHYRVSLLVVPLYSPPGSAPAPEIAALCEQVAEMPIIPAAAVVSPLTLMVQAGSITASLRPIVGNGAASAPELFAHRAFDVVHVFRLNAVPFAQPYLDAAAPRPRLHLDLDDIESLTAERLAQVYQTNGDRPAALFQRVLARRVEGLEAECFRRFDRIYVCSESDRTRLHGRCPAELWVIPNATRLPPAQPPKTPHQPFTFLFVGTLGYYPNADALDFFCRQVIPLIRAHTTLPFVLNVVGGGTSRSLSHLAGVPEVRLVGQVPAVSPWYGASDAVIVPIRAGGGTRIKILEAFAHRTPVVSTEMGMEGIQARSEEHALLGNTAQHFAQQCLRLMMDPALAAGLAANAFALVESAYSENVVLRIIAAACHTAGAPATARPPVTLPGSPADPRSG